MKWNEWYLVEIKNSEESWLMIALFNAFKIAEGNFATHKDLVIVLYPAFVVNDQAWLLQGTDITLHNPHPSAVTHAHDKVCWRSPHYFPHINNTQYD